jgi:hypothetical protein
MKLIKGLILKISSSENLNLNCTDFFQNIVSIKGLEFEV